MPFQREHCVCSVCISRSIHKQPYVFLKTWWCICITYFCLDWHWQLFKCANSQHTCYTHKVSVLCIYFLSWTDSLELELINIIRVHHCNTPNFYLIEQFRPLSTVMVNGTNTKSDAQVQDTSTSETTLEA